MRISTALTAAVAVGALAGLPAAAQAPGTPSAYTAVACDRVCLIGIVHRYMDALVPRDPSRAPLAKGVMFTPRERATMPG